MPQSPKQNSNNSGAFKSIPTKDIASIMGIVKHKNMNNTIISKDQQQNNSSHQ